MNDMKYFGATVKLIIHDIPGISKKQKEELIRVILKSGFERHEYTDLEWGAVIEVLS